MKNVCELDDKQQPITLTWANEISEIPQRRQCEMHVMKYVN